MVASISLEINETIALFGEKISDLLQAQKGHVWTAPGWKGFSSPKQQWSEQPCVRPVSAVHLTAGHNARRGSGPGQKLAFDNAHYDFT
jgi:hypothetical protein